MRRVDVTGPSMLPTILDGQRVTAVRRWRALKVGDVVVSEDPTSKGRLLIKRVAKIHGSTVTLVGDNVSASTDSRDFGSVPLSSVRWIVLDSSLR